MTSKKIIMEVSIKNIMNLNKHIEFFNPKELIKEEIHVLGCGALGSNVALQLAKLGLERIIIWDFDIVESHNITNQVYDSTDIGKLKTDALKEHLLKQNPNMEVVTKGKYTGQLLKGIIIFCIDSVETKHKIAEKNQFNIAIKLVIDGAIGLSTGQVYSVNWSQQSLVSDYIEQINFKDSEVQVPVSACGTTLSVSPSVLVTASFMISSLINYAKGAKNPFLVLLDAFEYNIRKIK